MASVVDSSDKDKEGKVANTRKRRSKSPKYQSSAVSRVNSSRTKLVDQGIYLGTKSWGSEVRAYKVDPKELEGSIVYENLDLREVKAQVSAVKLEKKVEKKANNTKLEKTLKTKVDNIKLEGNRRTPYGILKAREEKEIDYKEFEVVDRLQRIEGGKREYETPAGFIDLLTKTEIIECKEVTNWKAALGQLMAYHAFLPQYIMRLHLFGNAPHEMKEVVSKVCTKYNIRLTWDNKLFKL